MEEQLTYWKFLVKYKYIHYLIIGLIIIAMGFFTVYYEEDGNYTWIFLLIEIVGCAFTTVIILGGFVIHWKEYNQFK